MIAGRPARGLVIMTRGAGLLACVLRGTRRDGVNGRGSVVTELPEGLRQKKRSGRHQTGYRHGEHRAQPEYLFRDPHLASLRCCTGERTARGEPRLAQ